MSKFLDGPAAGTTLMLRRAPVWLRVVIAPDGTVDALDQPHDVPADDEAVHVYRQQEGTHTTAFICRTIKQAGGRYEFADYRYVAHAPTADLRSREAWQVWCMAQPGRPVDAAVPVPADAEAARLS